MKRTKFNYEEYGYSEKAKITRIEHGIQTCIINIKKDTYEIGKLLHKAKGIISHGAFQDWIKQTFGDDLPYSTAYLYMRIYDTFSDSPGAVQDIPTKFMLDLTQQKFPEEALEAIKQQSKDTTKQLDASKLDEICSFYKLMKKGTVGGNQFLQQVKELLKEKQGLDEDRMKNRNKHRMNSNARRTLYFGLGDILKKLDSAIRQARDMAGLFPFNPDDPRHQKIVTHIDKTIGKLQKLEKELEGSDKLFVPVSTPGGEKYL